jgi:hypothetical protein
MLVSGMAVQDVTLFTELSREQVQEIQRSIQAQR